jgi:hypothetical protein
VLAKDERVLLHTQKGRAVIISHIAEIEVEIKDTDALKTACVRCGAEFIGMGTHRVFVTDRKGIAVKPKGWTYPVVFADGKAAVDNFNGHWGDMAEFKKLRQTYAVEVAKKAAKRQGMNVREQQQKDGSIRLVCVGR